MRILFILLAIGCLPSPAAWTLEVTSIAPVAAPPERRVTLTGGPFSADIELFLGSSRLTPAAVEEKRLFFDVPELPEGEYALVLREPSGARTPATTFRVLELLPRIETLAPTTLDACSLQQGRLITLSGEFPPHAQLLLDGAIIRPERIGRREIVFTLPAVPGGMHQVEVVARNGRKSLPHALFIDQTPSIEAITPGADQLTSYEVIIQGRNFFFDSVVAVNGAPLKRGVGADSEQSYSALRMLGGDDYLRYIDCQTLIYVRHPLTREPTSLTLQVINPGGEQSQTYVVAMP